MPVHRGWQRGDMGRSGVLSSGSRFPCVISYISRGCWEQRPTPEWYNLHVGAVSRHRLDSLNASGGVTIKAFEPEPIGAEALGVATNMFPMTGVE